MPFCMVILSLVVFLCLMLHLLRCWGGGCLTFPPQKRKQAYCNGLMFLFSAVMPCHFIKLCPLDLMDRFPQTLDHSR